jgi:hypothetical protein
MSYHVFLHHQYSTINVSIQNYPRFGLSSSRETSRRISAQNETEVRRPEFIGSLVNKELGQAKTPQNRTQLEQADRDGIV